MSAIIGERDTLIMQTVPRFQPANDRVLLLAATAQQFKVAATTLAAPASIDFTAGLINMQGQVSFVASNASVLTRAGNVASLKYGDMVGDSVTVTATTVLDGLTYTASQTVSKVYDGITGNSARICYSKTSLPSLASTPATISSQGNVSFPPINTWGAGTVWEGSPQAFGAGESLYRSDGIFNPASGTTSWSAPYLNALKVGQLSAISADLGRVTAGDLQAVTLHGGPGYPHSNYAWPSNGQGGFHLSADGMLMGCRTTGKYCQVTASGDIYTPGFVVENGQAWFSGKLSGATGNFSGNVLAGAAPGFRIEIGPDDPVYAMWAGAGNKNDANAIFYVKRPGVGSSGGSLSVMSGTFSGDLSSARVSVGTSALATVFFEPDYPSVSLQSSATGVFVYSSSLSSASVFSSADVLFKHNDLIWPAVRRIRSGPVFFSINCTAVVDDQLSIWYRLNDGAWQWMSGVEEGKEGDGAVATGFGLTLNIKAGDTVQFGVSGTNASYRAYDMSKLYVKQCQVTVIARNF